MKVENIRSINKRLKKFNQRLNTADYLSWPRIEPIGFQRVPFLLWVKINGDVLIFGIGYLYPPSHYPWEGTDESVKFVTGEEIDEWFTKISEARELCETLNKEEHRVTY